MKRLALLLVCALLLTACSSASSTTTTDRDPSQLVIALTSEPEVGFDPCVGWGRYGSPLIQSTLVTLDANMDVVYDLATDYAISDDGLTWTFTIRDDALLSTGEPLTAQDVAFTYETAKTSGSVVDLTVLEQVNVLSDTQLEFILSTPQITFIYTVAQTGIVPEAYYDDDYYKNPIGSGAFTLLQWDQGQQAILGVNPYYYGDTPNFEQVTILFMTEETAFLAAQKGLVDVAITNANYADQTIDGMSLLSLDSIDNRGLTLPVLPDEGTTTPEGYPIGNNVTSDVAIRQALSYGIDREQLIVDCLNGYGAPAYSECDGMPWGNDMAVVDYDFDYACQLLDDAGWVTNPTTGLREKDGTVAEFTLLYTLDDAVRQALCYAVSLEAEKLGIAITVEGTSWDDIDTRMFSCAVLMGWGAQNPLETYYLYHSDNMGVDYYNPENYSSATTDAHLTAAMSATDYESSMDAFQAVQWDGTTGVSTLGETPWVWLVNVDHLFFVRDGLSLGNQKIHPHGHAWPVVGNLADWEWVSD
ncbi:ABC transporter substrate-binding protein [Bengtsoniella intestinalis]|uniref:ABC transporter substrate-binding protein n=1 Tax=Bengtsoniella intestinalis TaxID=3073143 RepID=UPI00391EF0D3